MTAATTGDLANYPRDKLPRAIFLDSGGVINDNDLRAPQWITHLEQYMPLTKLGGPGHLWGRANAILTKGLFTGDNSVWDKLMQEAQDFEDFDRRYLLYWIRTATELVNEFLKEEYNQQKNKNSHDEQEEDGKEQKPKPASAPLVQLVLPETEEEQMKIAKDAHLYCTALVQADYPGAVEAILKLKFEQGFEMYTCSGESALSLELTLKTLGISTIAAAETAAETAAEELQGGSASVVTRKLQLVFTKLYGPDLIRCQKSSSRFYELIFQDSGVDPKDAVVLDDKEYILGWAKVHGTRTVLISDKDRSGKELMVELEEKGEDGVVRKTKVPAVDHQLRSLAELPVLVEQWKKHLESITKEGEAQE
ncbi:hypothetical protein BGZ65_009204 [Modicella reniformis]|uniref:Uncharacterized protein n=1 Tax=Modicella reniformis TaxID=1440133 RepID=A0A9P6JGS1_9FUNG|nr:hypothetical protein BGZ65_009204 [Modicella reniformis]